MNQFYETPTALPEEMTEEIWYCFQTPKIEKQEKMTLIGMVDASGSMEESILIINQVWPKLVRKWNKFIKSFESVYTITFSESPLIRTPQLQENIYYHGGFQTNIYKSFIGLNRLLQSNKPKFRNITIVFISDGVEECRDTSLHQKIQALNLEVLNNQYNIQFICVGIGRQYSCTFAIKMRNIFYNTHYATPILITIDTVKLSNLFHNDLPDHIYHKQQGFTQEIIFQYPWDTQGMNKIYSDSFVFSKKSHLTVEFNNQKYDLRGQRKLQTEDCIKISRIWHRQLVTFVEIQNQSNQAHLALQILKQFSNQKKFKLTVWERIKLNKCRKNEELNYFMQEIKKIYINQRISNLSEKDQLSRQKIQTYQSKHHQYVSMACLCQEEFLEAKEEFITLLQQRQLLNQTNQECSIVSMQNTIDILMENDIIQALQECQNQYELVQSFPIVGQGLQIQRQTSTVFSEYQIKVLSMARHHKTIDSVSMLQKQYEIHLQTGDGDEEIINCIVPLFGNEQQLSPFISSKLYNMLVSYNITLNIDTFLDESYLSLLASSLVYLICQNPSNWQRQLLNEIKCTFFMLQSNKIEIDNIKNQLEENPNECFITVNFEKKFQCQSPTKILLIAYCYNMIDQQLIERIFLEQIGRIIDRDFKISDYFEFFEPQKMEEELQKINVQVNQENIMRTFYSFSELNLQVVHAYDDKLVHLVRKMEIKPPEFRISMIQEQLENTILEYGVLEQILKYFCNTCISNQKVIVLFYHAYSNAKSLQRNRTEVQQNLEFIFDEIRLAKYRPCIKQQKIEKLNFFKQFYQREIEKLHKIQKPLTMIQKQFMPNLKLHPQIGIVINACMSADCPHYLDVRIDYDKHAQSNSLCFLPNKIYEVIYQYRKESIQQIFDKISQNLVCRKSFLSQLLKDPLIVYLKIKDAQQVYNTYQ